MAEQGNWKTANEIWSQCLSIEPLHVPALRSQGMSTPCDNLNLLRIYTVFIEHYVQPCTTCPISISMSRQCCSSVLQMLANAACLHGVNMALHPFGLAATSKLCDVLIARLVSVQATLMGRVRPASMSSSAAGLVWTTTVATATHMHFLGLTSWFGQHDAFSHSAT